MPNEIPAPPDRSPGIDGPWTHEQAVVNGVRFHYVTAGDESDPLVIMLHGFPEFWYSWRHQLSALADAGFRVVAPDLRGYNRSEKPDGEEHYLTEKLVGDVLGLVAHFDREQTHLVGHDWGGFIAWETAIRHPDVVDQLAVVNGPHPGRFQEVLLRYPRQWRRSWYTLFFQIPWLPEALLGMRDCAGIARVLRKTGRPDSFSEEDLQRYRAAACRPNALTSALSYYRGPLREFIVEGVQAIVGDAPRSYDVEAPTLLIWGDQDPALGTELSEGLDKWIADLRVEHLTDATHWVQNDEPEAVNELLVEFFEE